VPEVKAPRSRAALLRNVGVESLILLVGVLALASLLANTPPTHNHTGQVLAECTANLLDAPRYGDNTIVHHSTWGVGSEFCSESW